MCWKVLELFWVGKGLGWRVAEELLRRLRGTKVEEEIGLSFGKLFSRLVLDWLMLVWLMEMESDSCW